MNKVYIVGAGCGSADYLTLKAYRLLTHYAEVIFYDRLIWQEVLDLIPPRVKMVFVGKEADLHHKTQDETNALLIEHAKAGKKVVRLKGGDPFIFGRGGEELQILQQNGIEAEVVPGISSAMGAAAEFGIPLTFRGVANSFRVITGHNYDGEELDLNWQSLADSKTTLAIYMGLKNLPIIAEKLIAAGLSKNTPALAVQEATTPNQKTVSGVLSNIAELVKESELKAPTMIFVGEVVGLQK
jgi:uroporphyrin-III C-methyltransferase